MKSIADLLPQAVGRSEVLRTARAQTLFFRWEEVVGPYLARHSAPDRFEAGTLYIATSGSAWAQELLLQKDLILDRMNALAGEEMFSELRTARARHKASQE